MKKIPRNLTTAESRAFWEAAERTAAEVACWPAWRRAGINVAHVRSESRLTNSSDGVRVSDMHGSSLR